VDNIKLFIKIVNNKNDLFYKCVEYFYIQDFKKQNIIGLIINSMI
jgi:hypothetical protein